MACSGSQSEIYSFNIPSQLPSTEVHSFFGLNNCVYGVINFSRTFTNFQCNGTGTGTIKVRDEITIVDSSGTTLYTGGYNLDFTRTTSSNNFAFFLITPGLTTSGLKVTTSYTYNSVNVDVEIDLSSISNALTVACMPPYSTPVTISLSTNSCRSKQIESFSYLNKLGEAGIKNTFFTTNSCVDGTITVTRTLTKIACGTSEITEIRDEIVASGSSKLIGGYTIQYQNGSLSYSKLTGGLRVDPSFPSEVFYTYSYKGEIFLLLFDNSAGNLDCVDGNFTSNLSVTSQRSSASINIPENTGCGPRLRINKEDDNLIFVTVTDIGYNYDIVGNKVQTVYENECLSFSSSFTLEILPNLTDDQIIQYVLTGFVYGKFTYEPKDFLNRLLLSPFRKFAARFQ